MISLLLALAVTATTPMLGGLPLTTTRDGAMNGMTDISPITRAEVKLRQDRRIRSIKIVAAGWQVVAVPQTSAETLVASICAILAAENIPASAEVAVFISPTVKPVLKRPCSQSR